MKTRTLLKKQKLSRKRITQKDVDRLKNTYFITDEQTFIKSKVDLMQDDNPSTCAVYPVKPSKKHVDFYKKFGVTLEDTWCADVVLARYIVCLIHATIEAGDYLVDWNAQCVDIQFDADGKDVRRLPLRPAFEVVASQFVDYLKDDIPAKSKLACANLGVILPYLWW